MFRRIDQYLFTNIVRQSYESYKAEQEWIAKYKEQSENDKKFYQFFYSKTRSTILNDEENDNERNTKILDYWHSVIENKEEYERWENLYKDKIRLDRMFIDVESFLMMFSHHR